MMSLVSGFKYSAHNPGISLHDALHGRDGTMVAINPKPNSLWLIPIAAKTRYDDCFVKSPSC